MTSENAAEHYKVGQVLYVLSSKYHRVIPTMIAREMTSRTREGEETSYYVVVGGDAENEYELSDILEQLDGVAFSSSDECRAVMLQRAEKVVEEMVLKAVSEAKVFLPSAEPDEHTGK